MVAGGVEQRADELAVVLTFGGAELVDALEPLWPSLLDHHHGSAGLPVIDRDESWPRLGAVPDPAGHAPRLRAPRDAWLRSGMEIGVNDGYAQIDRMLADGAL